MIEKKLHYFFGEIQKNLEKDLLFPDIDLEMLN
jgi:hypothetical protein